MNTSPPLNFKSAAIALLFSVILGPVGLLYASYRGGIFMIVIGIIVLSNKYFFPVVLIWLISCIWAVGAVEAYNKKLKAQFYRDMLDAKTN